MFTSLQLLQLSSTTLRVIELPLFQFFRSAYGENCCMYQNLDLQCEYYIGVSGRGSGLGVRDFQENKGLNSKNRTVTAPEKNSNRQHSNSQPNGWFYWASWVQGPQKAIQQLHKNDTALFGQKTPKQIGMTSLGFPGLSSQFEFVWSFSAGKPRSGLG